MMLELGGHVVEPRLGPAARPPGRDLQAMIEVASADASCPLPEELHRPHYAATNEEDLPDTAMPRPSSRRTEVLRIEAQQGIGLRG